MFDLSAMMYLTTHGLPLVAWLLSFLCNSCLTEFNDPLSSLKFTKKNKSKCSKIHLLLGIGFTLNVWREASMLSVFEIQTAFLISYIIKLIKILSCRGIYIYTTTYDIEKGNEPIFDMNKICIQQHNSCNTFLLLEQQLL